MRNVIFVLTILYSNCILAQKKSIDYYFSDSVETKAYQYISQLKDKENLNFYLVLNRNSDDEYELFVSSYKTEHKKYVLKWVFDSNRFAVIGNNKYPLIFDYDYLLSTTNSKKIGGFGNRDGTIPRAFSINHSYSIKFNKKGRIIYSVIQN